MNVFRLMIVLMALRATDSFQYFKNKIPNGDKVPNACFIKTGSVIHSENGQSKGTRWEGVGHLLPQGSGTLNAFGHDFKQNNFEWTRKFCQTDSDNDGRSNGIELGDPDCIWKPGSTLNLTTSLSHPGICDPVHSELCRKRLKNGATACIENKNPNCGALNDKDVTRSRFELSFTPVPTSGCGVFNLPQDRTYHLIAVSSRNINSHIRRILVYGCNPKQTKINVSRGCEHSQFEGCKFLLSELTKTSSSQCYKNDFGVRVGKNGFKQIMVSYEWETKDVLNVTESSYIELMYTETLRTYDMGFAEIGSLYFSLPQNQSDHLVTASCSSQCTRTFVTSPIFVVFGASNIRDFGKQTTVEVIRNGNVIYHITRSTNQNGLNSPIVTWHSNPLPLLPGDVIKLTCNYDTRPANTTVTWGTSDNQETCTSVIGYYPSKSWSSPTCYNYKEVPICDIKATGVYKDCNFKDFLKSVDTDITISAILETCFREDICSSTCTSLVWNMKRHPCLNGNLFDLWASNLIAINNSRLMKLFSAIMKCYKTKVSNFIKRKRFRFNEINKN